jgi:hypothetical protein
VALQLLLAKVARTEFGTGERAVAVVDNVSRAYFLLGRGSPTLEWVTIVWDDGGGGGRCRCSANGATDGATPPAVGEAPVDGEGGGAQHTTVEDMSGEMVAVSYGRLGCDAPVEVEADAGTFPMLVLALVLNGASDADMPANSAVEARLSRALKLASSPNGMHGMDMPTRGGVHAGASDEPGLTRGGRWRRGR